MISLFLMNSNSKLMNNPNDVSGKKFPELKACTLAGNDICFPGDLRGKKALIVIAFKQGAQSQADTWYDAYVKSFKDKGYLFYEIPMISGGWKWMSGWIDSGMRSGVPVYKHPNVSTYYGPLDSYLTAFDVKDRSLVYVFTLNEEGIIYGRVTGAASESKVNALLPKLN